MTRVLVTGMSGVGKSTVIAALGERGHRAVDTDSDTWSRWESLPDGSLDWVWREDAIALLLAEDDARPLFLAGCKSNQGRFYPQLTAVVLLTAPLETLLDRIAHRDTNPYGKSDEERALVVHHVATVEPLLRRTATHVVDATAPVPTIVEQLEAIAATSGSRRTRMAHGCVTATAGVIAASPSTFRPWRDRGTRRRANRCRRPCRPRRGRSARWSPRRSRSTDRTSRGRSRSGSRSPSPTRCCPPGRSWRGLPCSRPRRRRSASRTRGPAPFARTRCRRLRTWVVALAVGVVTFLPAAFFFGWFLIVAILWLGLAGHAVPAVMAERLGVVGALRRTFQLGRADYVHAAGSFAALAILFGLTRSALGLLLRSQADATVRTAIFLADVVLSPLLFLGAAIVYVDLVARVGLTREDRRRLRQAALGRPE